MKLAITGNLDKRGMADGVNVLLERLERSSASFMVDERVADLLDATGKRISHAHRGTLANCAAEADILVAFGGDGTILAAARAVGARATPILGVNLGKLGFLTELSPEELPAVTDDLLKGKYVVQERLVLEARIGAAPGTVAYAVNDIVVDKARSSRLIDVHTHIDGAFAVTYRGDGLIVSTPTGSTGYALSNNGPIVIPTCNVIGITPIAPHTLSGRPILVPDTSSIRIVVESQSTEVLISSDGQEEGLYRAPVEVTITRAPFPVRLVKRVDRSYFEVLRAKLFWGADARKA
jgi:NAD+ kinase